MFPQPGMPSSTLVQLSNTSVCSKMIGAVAPMGEPRLTCGLGSNDIVSNVVAGWVAGNVRHGNGKYIYI